MVPFFMLQLRSSDGFEFPTIKGRNTQKLDTLGRVLYTFEAYIC